jgi:hypothetical protein
MPAYGLVPTGASPIKNWSLIEQATDYAKSQEKISLNR